jgi:hypothetical protein
VILSGDGEPHYTGAQVTRLITRLKPVLGAHRGRPIAALRSPSPSLSLVRLTRCGLETLGRDRFPRWATSVLLSSIEVAILIAVVAIAVAAGAGVSVASRTSLPLRRDGHTKVYCGDQKSLCDRTHV